MLKILTTSLYIKNLNYKYILQKQKLTVILNLRISTFFIKI